MKKKRTIIRKREKEKSSEGCTEEKVGPKNYMEEKGKSTFSVIDGDSNKPEDFSLRDMTQQVVSALLSDKKITMQISDDRQKPNVEVNVDPTPVNFSPVIKVEPTPVEVRVPTQRIPDQVPPNITIDNRPDNKYLIIMLWICSILLFAITSALIWLSLMLSNVH